MGWVYLVAAGLFEIAMAISLKESETFTRLWPTVSLLVTGALSFGLLSIAMRTMPVGIAYPVWTGIGAAGTAIVGIALLGESRDLLKIISLVLLIGGVIGLRIAEGGGS